MTFGLVSKKTKRLIITSSFLGKAIKAGGVQQGGDRLPVSRASGKWVEQTLPASSPGRLNAGRCTLPLSCCLLQPIRADGGPTGASSHSVFYGFLDRPNPTHCQSWAETSSEAGHCHLGHSRFPLEDAGCDVPTEQLHCSSSSGNSTWCPPLLPWDPVQQPKYGFHKRTVVLECCLDARGPGCFSPHS